LGVTLQPCFVLISCRREQYRYLLSSWESSAFGRTQMTAWIRSLLLRGTWKIASFLCCVSRVKMSMFYKMADNCPEGVFFREQQLTDGKH